MKARDKNHWERAARHMKTAPNFTKKFADTQAMRFTECMKAASKVKLQQLRFPLYGSAKLDGIRITVIKGRARTRQLETIPNRHIDAVLSRMDFEGFDGEVIIGSPTADQCFHKTQSAMSRHHGQPQFKFYVFDKFGPGPFHERYSDLCDLLLDSPDFIQVLPQKLLRNLDELLEYYQRVIELGFEGLMLRSLDGLYKCGRSTVNEHYLMKMKPRKDGEALLIGVEEEMANTNRATVSKTGRTKRSGHKAGKVPKGRAGKLVLRLKDGTVFKCGSGLKDKDRDWFWRHRKRLVASKKCWIKFEWLDYGIKEKPREPTYKGIRPGWDM